MGIMNTPEPALKHCDKASPKGIISRLERLPFGGFVQQQSRWRKALAILLDQVLGPGDEVFHAVLIDELQRATGPGGEADAENRADVGVRRRSQHALLHATHGFDGLYK